MSDNIYLNVLTSFLVYLNFPNTSSFVPHGYGAFKAFEYLNLLFLLNTSVFTLSWRILFYLTNTSLFDRSAQGPKIIVLFSVETEFV